MEWKAVEPVLQATYRLLGERDRIKPGDVCEELGVSSDDEQTLRALAVLYRDGYIGGFGAAQVAWPIRIESTEKGLKEASGWPGDGAGDVGQLQLLLEALDERIDAPDTPETERSRLRRIRDAVTDAAPRLIGEVLAAYTAKVLPPTDGG